jgi:hypothetical protein
MCGGGVVWCCVCVCVMVGVVVAEVGVLSDVVELGVHVW